MARPTEEIRKACGIIDGVSNNEFAEVSVNKQTIREACDRIDARFSEIEEQSTNNKLDADIEYEQLKKVCAQIIGQEECEGLTSEEMAKEAVAELEKRLMPEGYEWPRFEETPMDNYEGERVKRPQVIAADGEPLEPGQTVWGVDSGKKYDVAWLERDVAIVDTYDGLASKVFASKLTHQRPVLDADGVPIDEGDTVWNATTSAGPFTVREIERSDDPDEPEDIVWCGEHAANGFKVWRIADQLTHAKPEPSDSRSAIVNEIGDEMAARIDLLVSSGRWSDAN